MLKPEIRVLGIDDASFDKFKKGNVKVIGALFRGGIYMDGCLTTQVRVDGRNATKKITDMIKKSKFLPQIQAIIIDGIAVGGFNIIDINKLSSSTKIPVIVVMRNYPKKHKMRNVLKRLGMEQKIPLLDKAGEIYRCGDIHFQVAGESTSFAQEVIKITSTRSHLPEPVRVAHLIGQGLTLGESRGKA